MFSLEGKSKISAQSTCIYTVPRHLILDCFDDIPIKEWGITSRVTLVFRRYTGPPNQQWQRYIHELIVSKTGGLLIQHLTQDDDRRVYIENKFHPSRCKVGEQLNAVFPQNDEYLNPTTPLLFPTYTTTLLW